MISLMKGFWKVEFEIKTDRVFTLKTDQMFSNHTTPEKFENVTIIGHFGFCLRNTREAGDVTWLSGVTQESSCVTSSFYKRSIPKCFPCTQKHKASVFIFHRFGERFRKAPFPWGIIVDGRSNPRGGGTLLCGLFRYVRPQRVWFFGCFGHK